MLLMPKFLKNCLRVIEKRYLCSRFFYPVVPKDLARIRVQLSASHALDEINFALQTLKMLVKTLVLYKTFKIKLLK